MNSDLLGIPFITSAFNRSRPEHLEKLLDLLFLGHVGELALELVQVAELFRAQEVQEMEQFFQVVLERRPRQEKLVGDRVRIQDAEELQDGTSKQAVLSITIPTHHTHTFDWLFFSRWASSTTRTAQSIEAKHAWSMQISS